MQNTARYSHLLIHKEYREHQRVMLEALHPSRVCSPLGLCCMCCSDSLFARWPQSWSGRAAACAPPGADILAL